MKAASALVEPSMKSPLKGLYITSTLVEARERVPVRIVNVADRDQVLSEGTIVGHVEPVAWKCHQGLIYHNIMFSLSTWPTVVVGV
jgi:hypothetical protein